MPKKVLPRKPAGRPAKDDRPLTPRQEEFARQYCVDYNAEAAYRRAGYATQSKTGAQVNASRLLCDPRIGALIADIQARRQQRSDVTRESILQGLLAEATYYGDGASHAARVRAYEVMAKIVGALRERVELTARSGPSPGHDLSHLHGYVTVDVDALPIETCRQLIEYRRQGNEQKVQEVLEHAAANGK